VILCGGSLEEAKKNCFSHLPEEAPREVFDQPRNFPQKKDPKVLL